MDGQTDGQSDGRSVTRYAASLGGGAHNNSFRRGTNRGDSCFQRSHAE